MKKGLIAAALGCALVSVSSHADTIAGVYVGAQVWQTDTQGGFADSKTPLTLTLMMRPIRRYTLPLSILYRFYLM